MIEYDRKTPQFHVSVMWSPKTTVTKYCSDRKLSPQTSFWRKNVLTYPARSPPPPPTVHLGTPRWLKYTDSPNFVFERMWDHCETDVRQMWDRWDTKERTISDKSEKNEKKIRSAISLLSVVIMFFSPLLQSCIFLAISRHLFENYW